MSTLTERIRVAYYRGYRVQADGSVISHRGRIRKLQRNKNGYLYFSISVDKKPASLHVHRLMAYQKFGERIFETGLQVRHHNNNAADNRPDNILLGTRTENEMDRPEALRIARAKHAASFVRRLTMVEARQLRQDRRNGYTYQKLCEKYKIGKSLVSYIINNITYRE
jgi:hypothetical protein